MSPDNFRPEGGPIGLVIGALTRADCSPRQSGASWTARCPVHDDRVASLSLSMGVDGRALLHCHAGCSPEAIVEKLGLGMEELFTSPARVEGRRTTYEIRNHLGTLVARHIREDLPGGRKRFFWQRPDGSNGLGGVPSAALPLYGSEELRGWSEGATIVVTEGEKAALALRQAGIHALGTVTGAGGCPDELALSVLAGRKVVLWPDADPLGLKHMRRVGQALRTITPDVSVFDWHGAAKGADAFDFIAAGAEHKAELPRMLASARPAAEWLAAPPKSASEPNKTSMGSDSATTDAQAAGRTSLSARLVALTNTLELFHSPTREGFAVVEVKACRQTLAIQGSEFERWLRMTWFHSTGGPVTASALLDTVALLDARSIYEAPERQVFTRIGELDGRIYIDLGDASWAAIEVTPHGWRLTASPPVMFQRKKGMSALTGPVGGGSVKQLRRFVNLPDEADWMLAGSWLVASLRPSGPFPILVLQGEQGSAKSTTARMLRSLVDPNTAALRTEPRSVHDLMISATNCWVQAYDNISHLSPWLSDALCRLATGGAFATRQLYSNNEETLLEAQRPVLLNGIEDIAARSDLLDRALVLNLPPIPSPSRMPETELWQLFADAKPKVMGALLDGVSEALRGHRSLRLLQAPRMADFATWAAAAAPGLGWSSEEFLDAYAGNRASSHDSAIDNSPLGCAVRDLITEVGAWEGTSTELRERLVASLPEGDARPSGWPASPRALSAQLSRIAPDLRALGIEVGPVVRHHGRGRVRTIKRNAPETVTSVTTVTEAAGASGFLALDEPWDASAASPEAGLRHSDVVCVTPPEADGPSSCASRDAGDANLHEEAKGEKQQRREREATP